MSLDSSVLSSRDDTIRIEKKTNDRKIRRTKTKKTKEKIKYKIFAKYTRKTKKNDNLIK
jgi:hypothetical protein